MSAFMGMEKIKIKHEAFTVNAFLFHCNETHPKAFSIFTHGYTSHKGSLLTWGHRLSEKGIPTLIFDLPAHFLGSFEEITSFESFTEYSPELFANALEILQKKYPAVLYPHLFLGGHSLGALMALKSLSLPSFQNFKKTTFAVGFGMAPQDGVHLMETPFYKKTLELRAELVSALIPPHKIFAWIREEKEKAQLTGEKIILITGEDDVIAFSGLERMKIFLEEKKNDVKVISPKHLPHHLPELAATHLMDEVKKVLDF
ncbi:MAG: alpha/beta fold hydrolase [Bacteriovoracaceae bacterium]|nr:alpha/beta fold hydrolase [Bacteriovoracaceae bacterium]